MAYIKLDTNLLDYSDWSTDYSGSTTDFLAYSTSDGQNDRSLEEGPFGPAYVWRGYGLTGDTTFRSEYRSVKKDIDPSFDYRCSVWIKRKVVKSAGDIYPAGIWPYNSSGTLINGTIKCTTGQINYQFYPWYATYAQAATRLPEDEWRLIVWYYSNSGASTGVTNLNSDFYPTSYTTGGTLDYQETENYIFTSDAAKIIVRSLLIYNADDISMNYALYPRIDKIDGTEPSLNTLITREGAWLDVLTGNTYIKVDDNLLTYADWTSGSTSNPAFAYATPVGAHYEVFTGDTDPFGDERIVWEMTVLSGVSGSGRNGWSNQTPMPVDINPNNKYRISYWQNLKYTSGSTLHLHRVTCNAGASITGLTLLSSGVYATTCNLSYIADYTYVDEWVLCVGHIFPHTWTGTTSDAESGLYSGGTKILSGTDWKFVPTATQLFTRAYMPYGTDNPLTRAQFIYPRIDLVDGTEPSLNTLLTGEGPWRRVPRGYVITGGTWEILFGTDPLKQMVAYYHLESGATDSMLNYDMSAFSTTSYGTGKVGNCFDDFRPNVYLYIDNNMGITGGDITVCMWCYHTSSTGDHPAFFSHYDDTAKVDYRIGVDDPGSGNVWFVARHRPNVDWGEITLTGVTDDTWTHMALVYSGTTLRMYKDGDFVSEATYSGSGTGSYTTSTRLGMGTASAGVAVTGKGDEVRVYNHALTSTEIKAIYDREN